MDFKHIDNLCFISFHRNCLKNKQKYVGGGLTVAFLSNSKIVFMILFVEFLEWIFLKVDDILLAYISFM